ncbi:hypothetical protein [Kingella sp. (in: b-proteobacteria)]|nr:hypothetical protein [Kingella sp. (in: b-proteobacteria)]MDO4658058.1 hypothetical protein [Kingella sp. (in: b-proteobacteria)]
MRHLATSHFGFQAALAYLYQGSLKTCSHPLRIYFRLKPLLNL